MVQDTAAVTSMEDVEQIESTVKQSLGAYYQAEQSPVRKADMVSLPDVRVDVCLYLIEPHQLPKEDIEAIKAVGKFAPVVPLLAKVRSYDASCLLIAGQV